MSITEGVNSDFLLTKKKLDTFTLLLLNVMNSLNSSEDTLCIVTL